jgi:hypothetical protein
VRGSFVARPHGGATGLSRFIEFIDENGGGAGVRLRARQQKKKS